MWYSFFFDRYRWLGGNCWPHHSCTRSWRQHIAAFVTQKTLILTLAAVRTWNLANSLYVLIWGQVTRVKRFGTILLPLAKIIGAELLPVFESWGCSRKYVIFNLSLSLCLFPPSQLCSLWMLPSVAIWNPFPIYYTMVHFKIGKVRGEVRECLSLLWRIWWQSKKMYEVNTRCCERWRRVVSISCSEEPDTFFCFEYAANIFIRNIGTHLLSE